MPLYNKNKDKAKITKNSQGDFGELAIFKDMEDKITISEVDWERTMKEKENSDQAGKVTGMCS